MKSMLRFAAQPVILEQLIAVPTNEL